MTRNNNKVVKEELNGIIISHKPVSENSLKRLLLIFDKIYFLHPDQNRFLLPSYVSEIRVNEKQALNMGQYGVFYNGQNYADDEDELFDKFDYAINKGILRIIHDVKLTDFYKKNWLPLRISYEYDSANAEIMNSLAPLVERNLNFSSENGLIRGSGLSFNNEVILPHTPPQSLFFENEEDKKFRLDHQLLSISGRINRFLAASDYFSLVPIFLNEHVVEAFSLKSEIAKMKREGMLNAEGAKSINIERNVQHLMRSISEIFLTDDILNKISVKELIIARENTYHECLKLRRKLVRALNFLSSTEFGTEFLKEVDLYLIKEVYPLVSEYQQKFISIINGFIKYSIVFGTTLAGSVISYQQSLSNYEIAYYGGVSATVGAAVSDLSDYLLKKPNERLNTFIYFTNLKN